MLILGFLGTSLKVSLSEACDTLRFFFFCEVHPGRSTVFEFLPMFYLCSYSFQFFQLNYSVMRLQFFPELFCTSILWKGTSCEPVGDSFPFNSVVSSTLRSVGPLQLVATTRKSQMTKGKILIERHIGNFVPCVAVTKQSATPPFDSSPSEHSPESENFVPRKRSG